MLYKKEGFPEDSELVLCTVTGIQHHIVFVRLDEYDKTGIIHISEIAPGRVRNIREYVAEGKKIVCKVLRVNEERGQLDLSLRRVTEYQKRQKANQIKQEQLAEKIIEFAAKELKKPFEEVYAVISKAVLKTYPYVYACFEDIVNNEATLENLGVDKKIAATLEVLVKQRIKPPEVQIEGNFMMTTFAPHGVADLKKVLAIAVKDGISPMYLGGGRYHVSLKDKDYKAAEERLAKTVDAVLAAGKKLGITAEFQRIEKGKKDKKQEKR